ncbi:GNAT family N-acetyltransferase [Paenibacillus oceani]|uniref:GNAT family N-acetyltransferase n=1 Tax=Paenibacillus oceani TaxID=2772510 RepID=A0A927CDP4_9BACL|nr:GNAT family N-acetyltransferase [Paenibacillus oceani]MBD2864697.1 GNAT family N-acetyltransferase [Paenibacillus oceani]
MEDKLNKLEIRSLGDCTIREITEQWNTGFQQYLGSDSIGMSIVQTTGRLGRLNIHPDLSVAAFVEGVPAGFVMIGLAEANGRKLAWNGGTGVNPSFRGHSLSKLLLREAIRRTQSAGAHSLSLETRIENDRAIRSYLSCGFEIRDQVHVMRKEGGFADLPFARSRSSDYRTVPVAPCRAGLLPFYPLAKNSWTVEWFMTEDSEAIIALDHYGEAAGYAIYRRSLDSTGRLDSIQLTQCEADPQRGDGRDVIRFMLADIFSPLTELSFRSFHYLRESNGEALMALHEAGFITVYSEHLMTLDFERHPDA